jgi:very-short-patch-repair endonuclease
MNCKFCGKELKMNGKSHQSFCEKNPNRKNRKGDNNPMSGKKGSNQYANGLKMDITTKKKISEKLIGKQLSNEVKAKISESMLKAHKEKRAWNIGKSRWNNTESYPESFFRKVIQNDFFDHDYKQEYSVGIYSIDFAWVEKKKAIEIDGEQHERFEEYKRRDDKKDEFLKSEGWEILRIKWKDMCNDTQKWIQVAFEFIHIPR